MEGSQLQCSSAALISRNSILFPTLQQMLTGKPQVISPCAHKVHPSALNFWGNPSQVSGLLCIAPVLVSLGGYCARIALTRQLIDNRNKFLTFLEARSRDQGDSMLSSGEHPLLGLNGHFSFVSSCGEVDKGTLGVYFIKAHLICEGSILMT